MSTTTALFALAIPVTVMSAIRSTWSPCGLSMLSSITPMTEAGRGHRFSWTATWFVIGGVTGGLSLGAAAALGALGLSAFGVSGTTLAATAVVVGLVTVAIDTGIVGPGLPILKRQVNDEWLGTYRAWVYGAGFGWQIGAGLTTYIMTAGVFLVTALAVLTANPLAALVIGAIFGLVRGLAVLVGRDITSPALLNEVHRRLDTWAPASHLAAVAVQAVAAVVAAGLAWGPAGVGIVSVAVVAMVTAARASRPATVIGR